MTVATYLLLALAGATLLMSAAFVVPRRRNLPHAFVTDPRELEWDHVGRHEMPEGAPAPRPLLGRGPRHWDDLLP